MDVANAGVVPPASVSYGVPASPYVHPDPLILIPATQAATVPALPVRSPVRSPVRTERLDRRLYAARTEGLGDITTYTNENRKSIRRKERREIMDKRVCTARTEGLQNLITTYWKENGKSTF